MPSFDEILNNRKSNQLYAAATPNVVVIFDSGDEQVIFAKHEPDSGLIIDDRYLLIDSYKTPSLTINHENAQTSFPSTSLDLISIDGDLFNFLSVDPDLFTGKKCSVFLGFINAGMDLAEYEQEPMFTIDSFTQKINGIITFKLTSVVNQGNKPAFQLSSSSINAISEGLLETLSFIDEGDLWPDEGFLLIDDELVQYENKTPGIGEDVVDVDLILRAAFASIGDDHDEETEITLIDVIQDHPVDIILQILTSTGEGTNGIYDVLTDGAGIPIDDIDVSAFLDIRGDNPSQQFRLFVSQLDSVLKYIEEELLKSNNYRLVLSNKISLVRLSISLDEDPVGSIGDDDIQTGGSGITQTIDAKKIVNSFTINWAKTPDGRFLRTSRVDIQDSIDRFGLRPDVLTISGAQVDLLGGSFVLGKAIGRGGKFGFNQSRIKLKTLSAPARFRPGTHTQLETTLLSSIESSESYNRVVEVTSNNYDHLKSSCTIEALDSPWIRALNTGRFQATPAIQSVTSQTIFVFDEDDIFEMAIGDMFRLFSISSNGYVASGNREITDITGGTITIDSAFDIIATTDHRFWPSPYDDASSRQKNRFAYFSDEDNNFPDGGPPYIWAFG